MTLLNSSCIPYLTNNDYSNIAETFLHYNGAINYSDCTIWGSMEVLSIGEIGSFDDDSDLILE